MDEQSNINISDKLKVELLGIKGFGERNLKNMRLLLIAMADAGKSFADGE